MDSVSIPDTEGSSLPSLRAAEAIRGHRDVGKIIAQHMLKLEAKAFIMKRIADPYLKISERRYEKIIPLHAGLIGVLSSQKITIWSPQSGNVMQTITPEVRHGRLYAKPNKRGDKVVTTTESLTKNKVTQASAWNVDDGTCIRIFNFNTGDNYKQVQFITDGSDEYVIAAALRSIKMWSINSGHLRSTIECETDISSIKTDPDAKLLLIAYDHDHPQIWDLETETCVLRLENLRDINKAKFSPGGHYVVIHSFSQGAVVYSVESGKRLYHENLYQTRKFKIIWDSEGKKILLVGMRGDDPFIYLLKIEPDQSAENIYKASSLQGNLATFSKSGNTILYAQDNIAHLWAIGAKKREHTFRGHAGIIDGISFNSDSSRALTTSKGRVKVWDVETGLCLYDLNSHWGAHSFFSGSIIVSHNDSGSIYCLHVQDLDKLFKDITFEQALLINALYEIIILRRLATIRAAAQVFHALIENKELQSLEESRNTSFPKGMQKLRWKCRELFSEFKGQPKPMSTEDGKILKKEDFLFDFTNKPQTLLAAYQTLEKPIRKVLNPFIKISKSEAVQDDDSSMGEPESSGDSADEEEEEEEEESVSEESDGE